MFVHYSSTLHSGGCFWGVELAFQRVPGVIETSVGYTAGQDKSPTYNSVCSGQTGHTEAVQVTSQLLSVLAYDTCPGACSICDSVRLH